ncbi:hypothetical protein Krac_1141 [Ktedonobacter racemifer DSM 44963]|uniref:Uncharacterized protein n=1 Tax=Ktedonobacter racemifer DSM 44963 TaxID=485913 RepID=D6U6B8_KTERA|nr:hypothetical protein Krac_1141 [Ktedonobacter racemifer DSM 44963]
MAAFQTFSGFDGLSNLRSAHFHSYRSAQNIIIVEYPLCLFLHFTTELLRLAFSVVKWKDTPARRGSQTSFS